jgi:hypothetical protein
MNIISIHTFPHELRNYKRIVDRLNVSMFSLNIRDIEVWVTLNLNKTILDFKKILDIDLIVEQFKNITNELVVKYKLRINLQDDFLGVNEHRIETINNSDINDYIMFLDSDLFFNHNLLKKHVEYAQLLKKENKLFIITPQCIRLWDATWDCVVNMNFLKKPLGYYKKIDPNEITKKTYGNLSLNKLSKFKWANGWFTGMSAELAKIVNIPKSFKGYGPDDTYMMECCKFLKQQNYDINQYTIRGLIVCEDVSIRNNFFKKDIPNFRQNCNRLFNQELETFRKRI